MQQHQVQVIPNQLIMDYKMNKENELIKSLIQNKLKSNEMALRNQRNRELHDNMLENEIDKNL